MTTQTLIPSNTRFIGKKNGSLDVIINVKDSEKAITTASFIVRRDEG